jgi:hypothetical protein
MVSGPLGVKIEHAFGRLRKSGATSCRAKMCDGCGLGVFYPTMGRYSVHTNSTKQGDTAEALRLWCEIPYQSHGQTSY